MRIDLQVIKERLEASTTSSHKLNSFIIEARIDIADLIDEVEELRRKSGEFVCRACHLRQKSESQDHVCEGEPPF